MYRCTMRLHPETALATASGAFPCHPFVLRVDNISTSARPSRFSFVWPRRWAYSAHPSDLGRHHSSTTHDLGHTRRGLPKRERVNSPRRNVIPVKGRLHGQRRVGGPCTIHLGSTQRGARCLVPRSARAASRHVHFAPADRLPTEVVPSCRRPAHMPGAGLQR